MYSIEIELTELGKKDYQKVLAIVFEYLRLLKEVWLTQPDLPKYFEEQQKIGRINYQVYTVPDQEESTCSIGDAMVHSTDISNILEETYGEILIDGIDRDNLVEMAGAINYGAAKIVFSGNEILSSDIFDGLAVTNDEAKEAIFGSRFKTYGKPTQEENRATMTDEEWGEATRMLN